MKHNAFLFKGLEVFSDKYNIVKYETGNRQLVYSFSERGVFPINARSWTGSG
jgi:hypothetical protein